MAAKRFHFDLSHLGDETPELTFHVGRNRYSVSPHTADTREAAMRDNRALALVPKSHHHRITHFADVEPEHLPTDRLCRLRVTHKHPDESIHLPVLVHAAFHIPEKHRSAHRRAKHAKGRPHLPHKLSVYGVDVEALAGKQTAPEAGTSKKPRMLKSAAPVLKAAAGSASGGAENGAPADDTQQVSADADQFGTPLDVAAFILFHHPGLASSDTYIASRIMDDHIHSAENQQALTALSIAIEDQGPGGWTTIQQAVMPDGTPMTYEVKLGNRNIGDPVQQYVLLPDVLSATPAALQQPLKTAADDPALQNKKWSVTQGTTAVHQTNVAKAGTGAARLLRAGAPSRFKWTLKEQNHSNGLSVDSDSISFDWNDKNDGSGAFHIEAKNTHLRTLAAYIEFIDESGNVIDDPEDWQDRLPIPGLQTKSKKFVTLIPAVSTIMGIPIPDSPTRMRFPWPKNATSARLLFGGLGKGDWDGDVCLPGTIFTGVFQYGIPFWMLTSGSSVKDSSYIDDFLANPGNWRDVLIAAGVLTYVGLQYTDSQEILKRFAVQVAGILVKRAMAKILGWVLTNMVEDEAEEAVPLVGLAVWLVNASVAAAELTVTTLEVTSSPATIRYEIARAFDLKVTVKPDPAHGEPGLPETAVWPAVSDNYEVIVQYERGTNFVQKGDMPKTTSNEARQLTFPALPAGGRLQVIATIYSESGWLCGKWTSGWMDAVPAEGNTLTVVGTIEEQLVPLTMDSQYAYKEKIIYDAARSKHVWEAGSDPPTATFMNLSTSNTGPALGKLVNLTIFERTFEIGYSWQAASQGLKMTGGSSIYTAQAYAFRNLSVLADPESRLKFPNRSFAAQPYIVYDQYGQPTDPGSGSKPHQFFIDPRDGKCHLREIVLDDGNSEIDLTATLKSWGQFPLSNIDAMVVNSGTVIGASWANHNLAILSLPGSASDDATAPQAIVVSGEGMRQGLLRGPVAMAVTPDGRLLVLETINQRIQAFNLSGNPVPCFDGPKLFSISAASFSAELDGRVFSPALQTAFRQNDAGHLFDLDAGFLGSLNQSKLTDDLRDAFGLEGIFLSVNASDPNVNAVVTVVTPSLEWQIECKVPNRKYVIAKADQKLVVYALLNNTEVSVRTPGQQWIVSDKNGAVSYKIKASSEQVGILDVCSYNSYMPLENPTPGKKVTFLDLATEARGYIYVLCYTDSGTETTDYFLDIYEPNGAFLCRTPDERYSTNPQNVVAARLAVDTWRNAFTLNYEAEAGPNGSTEPTIGHWMPVPPLFSLELSSQPSFDKGDVGAVRNDFGAQHKPITLGDEATITIISTAGHWKVTDGATVYDVIRSGDKLDVYKLAPGARI
jgi:hypothetical protein